MSEAKPVLYILMEIKSRELEGRLLLGLEAACRGFQVVIGHKSQIKRALEAKLLPKGMYFYKDLGKASEELLRDIAKIGCLISGQDEESGILDKTYERFIEVRSTPETVSLASAVFCWGEYDYRAWSDSYKDAQNKIHLTGAPRIDFWRQDFQSYFKTQIIDIKNRFRKFVLIPSNFGAVNGYMTIDQRVEWGKQKGIIADDEQESVIRRKHEDCQKMFKLFLEMINDLADTHQDINFVVRPHPGEKMTGWTDNLAQRNNIHVICEGAISPWTRAAMAVLHNGCTTGIEAYVAGVPGIAYVPFASPINREIPNELSIECDGIDKVSALLTMIASGQTPDNLRSTEKDKLAKSRLANIDGPTAVRRMVDVFETLNIPTAGTITKSFAMRKLALRTQVRKYLNKFAGADGKARRKFAGLKLHELRKIKNGLNDVEPQYADCVVRHLFGDVFTVNKD